VTYRVACPLAIAASAAGVLWIFTIQDGCAALPTWTSALSGSGVYPFIHFVVTATSTHFIVLNWAFL